MSEDQNKMIQTIAQTIYDRKGFNILAIDVREVSTMTNFFIVAEGAVERHVQALCRDVIEKMKELGYSALHIDGEQNGDWIAIDFGDVIIHILIPEMREKYALEQVWKDGKLIELDIKKEDE